MELTSIGNAAKTMGISIDTLRRWDKSGQFPAIKRGGKRFYRPMDVEKYLKNLAIEEVDLLSLAQEWVSNPIGVEPNNLFFCQNSAVLQARLKKMEDKLEVASGLENLFPLIVAIAGEIGNNSFDHNLGNWPDVAGIFFGYDIVRREIVLADRGQGIFKTLQRIKRDLSSDEDALQVAFTEIISGRAPEARGNGLKFVKNVVVENDFTLFFQSGSAKLELKKGDTVLNIIKAENSIHGCLALIKF